ncbi:YbjQ family protein [Frankia sp. Cas3]|uniref:YbjQ family protein n=1 Tax=Frankia sp. Cas3 TaxID=3073926 RepID=UPI002AD23575|nr:YbjQ family protein [Frankia sp. Cas3]
MTQPSHDSIIDLPISTTFDLPGFTVERTLGLCWGLIVRSVGAIKGISGGLRALRAGEVPQYTEVVDAARRTALERLVAHTRELGGNAVLGVRFDSSDVGNGLAEIVAYGTAAVVRPN